MTAETVRESIEILKVLGNSGGYGIACIFVWLWRNTDKERIRYRDFHEETIRQMPKLVEAVEKSTEQLERIERRI